MNGELLEPSWLLALGPLWLLWALTCWRAPRTRWLRLLQVSLLPLLLARPQWRDEGAATQNLVVVDRSRSVGQAGLEQALALATELRTLGGQAHNDTWTFAFGDGSSLVASPNESLEPLALLRLHDASNLTEGLQLALAQRAPQRAARLIVLSDGLYTGEDPAALLSSLRDAGVPVYALPIARDDGADVAVSKVLVPRHVPEQHGFTLAVQVDSARSTPAHIGLRNQRGEELSRMSVELAAGTNRFTLPARAGAQGTLELSVYVEVSGDPIPENNTARSAVLVEGEPHVLLIRSNDGQGALGQALAKAGVRVQVRRDSQGLRVADLAGIRVVILENTSLSRLGDGADQALAHYVRWMGGGLLLTGGRQSYAMGGYFRSALEPLLPVVMDRKEELRRPRVALTIALDRSGSMSAPADDGTKMDLANRGAAEAISLLAIGDQVSVLAVDTAAHVVVPLRTLSTEEDRQDILDKVLSIESAGGGIYVHTALSSAVDQLLRARTPTRHVVLFSDASDSEAPGNSAQLVAEWQRAGGSLSVIGLGSEHDSDAELLQRLARLGAGRIYFTAEAGQLPRIFAQDVMHVARKTFIEGDTPTSTARGLLGLGFAPAQVPHVGGYNLTYLAPGAEALLVTKDKNHAPLAASWQRGSGRVLAVTFEADGPFTGAVAQWEGYQPFFRAAVEWLEQEGSEQEYRGELQLDGNQGQIRLEVEPGGKLPDTPVGLLLAPGASEPKQVPLHWVGPSELEASFSLERDGVHHAVIQVPGARPIVLAPATLPYSPEFEPHRRGRSGWEVLSELAEGSGGSVLASASQLDAAISTLSPRGTPLGWLLAGLMLGLMLVDISLRRGLLDAALQALRRRLPTPRSVPAHRARKRSAPAVSTGALPEGAGAAAFSPAEPTAGSQESALLRAKKRARTRVRKPHG